MSNPISLKPCGHHLVVEPIKLPEKSKGGIILRSEGTMAEKLDRAGRMVGVILAVGPQCWQAHAANLSHFVLEETGALEPWAVVGDTVLYGRHAGKFCFDPMDSKEDQRELYLIHDDDVLCVYPPEADWVVGYNDITI